jgi:hypothetical protein
MNTKRISAAISFGLATLLAGAEAKTRSFHSDLLFVPQATTEEENSQQGNDAMDEESVSQDPKEREARLTKNMRYNGGGCDITALTPGHSCFFDQVWPRALPLIPLKQSTIAFAGQISKMQPYLSEDRTHIYTEITIRIEEVFKNPPNSKIPSGQTVVINQIGGTIRMTSGQVVHDGTRIDFLGKTHLGGRYVLFAKGIHGGKDLTLIRGYELRDGQVFKLRENGSPGPTLVSTIPGAANTLSLEKAFLQAVRKAALQGKEAHRAGCAYVAPQ